MYYLGKYFTLVGLFRSGSEYSTYLKIVNFSKKWPRLYLKNLQKLRDVAGSVLHKRGPYHFIIGTFIT